MRRDDGDDDARGGGRRGDREHAARAGHERVPDLARAHPVAAVEEAQRERDHGGDDHRAERAEADREQDDDQHQAREVVAPAGEQLEHARRLEVEALDVVAARVGLDRQQDADVVEDRRHERVDEHLQVADLEDLGDDERGGAERRRGEDRADAGRGHDPAALVLGVAGLAQQRPGDAAERDGGRHAGARDGAEQEAGERARAARAGLERPNAAKEISTKKRAAPENSSTAP